MHRSLDSAAPATGSAASLQSAGSAFRVNGRRFGVRGDDLWSGLDELVASVRLAGDRSGDLFQLRDQAQQSAGGSCRSISAQGRAIDGGLSLLILLVVSSRPPRPFVAARSGPTAPPAN